MWILAYLIYTILIKLWDERFISMGFFVDDFDDLISKYAECDRSGDFSGAEAALLKAFQKNDDDDLEGDLYYLLSLVQLRLGKDDAAINNMQKSRNLGNPDAADFLDDLEDDDNMDLETMIREIAPFARQIIRELL